MNTLRPTTAAEVESAVREALTANQPLEIIGHGTRRALGHQSPTNALLDLSALDAVTLYEPEELVLTVQAGAPLAEVQALLAQKRQEFAFEPMDTAALLGTPQGQGTDQAAGQGSDKGSGKGSGTIGGMIGTGLAGPRRIKAGGVRDHLLGLHAVSGFGDSFKTGGRVVKNVTGYDLCKLACGAFGTLAVMTEMTLKVMPKAEAETTLILAGLDVARAGQAMTAALGSPYDVSAAAHLPPSSLRGPLGVLPQAQAATLIRLEGISASVLHRVGTLSALLRPFGAADQVTGEVSAGLWAAIRDVTPFAASGPLGRWPVWRIVCPPAAGAALGEAIARKTGGDSLYDWAGGLIWAALPPAPDAHAGYVRAEVERASGHATLFRASDAVRSAVDVFPPLPPGVAALNARIKSAFDPQAIFNRGRLLRTQDRA